MIRMTCALSAWVVSRQVRQPVAIITKQPASALMWIGTTPKAAIRIWRSSSIPST